MDLGAWGDALKGAARERIEGMGETAAAGVLNAIKGNPLDVNKPPSLPTLEASAKPAVAPTATQEPPARPVWFWPLIAALVVLLLGGLFWFVAGR